MQKIEVLHYEVKTGVAKKTGNAYSIPEAQCVVINDDGSRRVGIINLPKDHPVVKPGIYTPTYRVVQAFGDMAGKLVAQIDTLVPVKA